MESLLLDLKRHNVDITVVNGEIELSIPDGFDATEIIHEVGAKKQDLIKFFTDSVEQGSFHSIKPAAKRDYYALSSTQRRAYFLYEFDKTSLAYNLPQVVKLNGVLDEVRFEETFKKLIARHESLRTHFSVIEGEIVQIVSDQVDFKIVYFESKESKAQSVIKAFIQPFDLSEGPLIRVGLVRLSPKSHLLLVDMHHIITDGASQALLIKDFMSLYNGETLSELSLQYKDYAEWQQGVEHKTRLAKQKQFWINELSEEVIALDLPTDFERPFVKNHTGNTIEFSLDKEVTDQLGELGDQVGATMFMTILSLFNVLLSKLSNQEDITIGSPMAGRVHADLDVVIGSFINSLIFRNFPKGNLSFTTFLTSVTEKALLCFDHQSYQYEELIEDLNITRDTSRNPLFDVMFVFQNFEQETLTIPGLELTRHDIEHSISKLDLTFRAGESAGQLHFGVEYSTELFKRETIDRFINYFKRLVANVLVDPTQQISEIDILSSEERRQLIHEFNNTAMDYPSEKTIIDLFGEQVLKTQHNPALIFGNHEVSYTELNDRATQLAHYIKDQSISQDSIISIMVERSFEMIIAILGVLKAGCTYLPIDSGQPEKRVCHILKDSGSALLITQSNFKFQYENLIKVVDVGDEAIGLQPKTEFSCPVTSSQAAYIIYTSGSTGSPKGTLVSHQSVINLIYSQRKTFGIDESERILQFSTIGFDASVEQTWLALLSGAALVLIPHEILTDSEKFNDYIASHQVTHLHATPSFLESINLKRTELLKRIIAAGESCSIHLANRYAKTCDFYNKYGVTESTVTSLMYKNNPAQSKKHIIPIGRPIGNTSIYILDRNLHLQPQGVIGELCIGGDGLAQGYLKNEALTGEKFVDSPFVTGERIYKTGDMARWSQDGNVEFLGRADDQVKIRGFRIELGEIEYQLTGYGHIKEAVVIAKEDEDGKHLVAYYVAEEKLSQAILQDYLSERLPDYMVPTYYVLLNCLPVNSNGKIDKKTLVELEHNILEDDAELRTPTEKKLAEIWSIVLNVDHEKIGSESNFFTMGGHSLKAISMLNRIKKEFKVSLSLTEFFTHQTVSSLGAYITESRSGEYFNIQKAPEKNTYTLSSAQKRIYFLHEFDKASLAYNMPYFMELEGHLDKVKLEKTFVKLISRHESFRTRISVDKGEIVQQISSNVDFAVEHYKSERLGIPAIIEHFIRPFDLNIGPLIRVGLAELSHQTHLLMVDMHHVVTDGVSQGILIKDFMSLYTDEELPIVKLQYKDYAEWQQGEEQQTHLTEHRNFWLNEFREPVSQLDLPTGFRKSSVKSYEGSTIGFSLDNVETARLKSIGEQEGATMFMVVLAVFNVLLSKLSGQEDIIVGTPTAGRGHSDLESVIGMFINALALRNCPKGNLSFEAFLSKVKEKTLSCVDHQSYQYEDLVDALDISRETNRNPLFDVLFVFQNFDRKTLTIPGLTLKPYDFDHNISKFDLTLRSVESDDQLHFYFEYSTALFTSEIIGRFIDYFKRIVTAVITDPAKKLSEINIVSFEERNLLLNKFNDNTVAYPNKETVIDLFKSQVSRTPNKIAVVFEGTTVTYDELDKRSNRLGYLLRKEGVERDTIVSLLMGRSIDTVIGMLSILKAGGAYLPIDIDYPEDRIRYLLKDSGSLMLLTKSNLADRSKYGIKTLFIDELGAAEEAIGELPLVNEPSDLCYIIYTSGTTGHPKGVMVEHRNVVRLFYNEEFQFDFGPEDVWTMFHSPSFDFSVWEMYGALLYGGKLIVIPKMLARDPEMYLNTLREHGVTVLNQTPSAFYNVMTDQRDLSGLSLRYVIFGGEALSPVRLKAWKSLYPQTKLVNMFGITETTVHVTYKELTTDDIEHNIKTIGKPIPTLSVYLLDAHQQLVAPGVKGELFIGGGGVTRGYLNNELLTEQKFITNPYDPTERLYRSGDLARLMNNGELEYLGRIDDQVQLRGFRIELGEIESCLSSHEQISEAVVVSHEQEGDQYLVGYYVSTAELDASGLRMHLSSHLPDYMLPSHYVHLDKIPLTSNGKTDRKRLPSVELTAGEDYVAPRTDTERKLVEIWSEVLNIDSEVISVTQSFFELGGHSLKATLLVNKISRDLEVLLPLKEIFTHQDISSLAELINQSEKENYSGIQKASKKDQYPLSAAQRRLYFLYEFDKESLAYNLPQTVRLEGSLDKIKLKDTFTQLIARHESLRTSFAVIDGEVSQNIIEDTGFKIEYFESTEADIEQITEQFIRPFDLYQGLLIRVGLIAISEQSHILLVDMHHIITDGVSQAILIRDFMSLYSGKALPETGLQYKDYAEWQQNGTQQSRVEDQRKFWLNEFSEEVAVLDLPTDFARPVTKSNNGLVADFIIDKEQTAQLKILGDKAGATMFMTVLSLFNVLLSKLSNQEDITIGTPAAGRSHADLEGIIGMFVNTVVLRNLVGGQQSFETFLLQVKEKTLSCFGNQSYQYEELIEDLNVVRDRSRNPLFDVMFVFQNFEQESLNIPGLELKPYTTDSSISRLDFTLTATEISDQLHLNIQYSTDLFKPETIERFIGYFQQLVSYVIEHPYKPISELDLLSSSERHQLLYQFNNTAVNYPDHKTIIDLFEDQVTKTPRGPALTVGAKRVSYQELNNHANEIAQQILEKVGRGNKRVGLLFRPSIEMIASMLGVLKSGCAYVPLSPDAPAERNAYILKDSEACILLTQEQLNDQGFSENISFKAADIVTVSNEINSTELTNPNRDLSPDDLIYVIYTSGTTGTPKGVEVKHKGVVNYILWSISNYDYKPEGSMLQLAAYHFDGYTSNLYSCLLSGGKLVLSEGGEVFETANIMEIIRREEITYTGMTPGMFGMLLEAVTDSKYLKNLQSVVLAGEQSNTELIDACAKKLPHAILTNEYGPSEASVCSTFFSGLKASNTQVIGKPISNTSIYILSQDCQLLPLGVRGEICISGVGIAKGYVHNPKLTSEKFLDNPFKVGEKLYRTGDVGRWLPDGNIEYFGRIDDQVKIRGYRIELGEIESKICDHDKIKESVVLIKEKDGDKQLAAYYTSLEEIDQTLLRTYLSERLPDYMVPSYLVHVDSFPLTLNGKIDKKSLPDPELIMGDDYVAPSGEIEEKLVAIWAEVLKIEKEIISVTQSFFELGGHSLKATVLVNQISKVFDVIVPLKVVFTHQNIQSLSVFIGESEKTSYTTIPKAARKDHYPLSGAQRGMYFLHELDKTSLAYNMPHVIELTGVLDREKLESTFEKLTLRHESLRTSFRIEQQPVQIVHDHVKLNVEYFESEASDAQSIIRTFVRPFDLEKFPLIRAGLIKLSSEVHILVVDMHHIITDGVSQGILIKDFMALYNNEELSAISVQYKDYSEWQQSAEEEARLSDQREFWKQEFSEEVSVLNLPTDFPRPKTKSYQGDKVSFSLSKEETNSLKLLGESVGATLFMTTLSIFNVLLSKLTGQEDVTIGTPVAGREHADVEDIMGVFLNTLVLRHYPKGELSFKSFLSLVKERVLSCFGHQSFQYEELIEVLKVKRDPGRNPLFDVRFVFQNLDQEELIIPDLTMKSYPMDREVSKFDLMMTVSDAKDELRFNLEYSTDLFKKQTIDRFTQYFKRIIIAVLKDPTQRISEIDILSKSEKKQLLHDFNDTKVSYQEENTITGLFKEQVNKTPNKAALVYQGKELTYRELDNCSDSIASLLVNAENQSSLVGIYLEPCLEMIVAILAVLKSGKGFLPLDPVHKSNRHKQILKESSCNIILTTETLENTLVFEGQKIVFTCDEDHIKEPTAVQVKTTCDDLAYGIYTSGSTGQPKGVGIKHSNVTNYVHWFKEFIQLNAEDKSLLTSSYSFDLGYSSIFPTLLTGGELHLIPNELTYSPDNLLDYIENNGITYLKITPSLFSTFFLTDKFCANQQLALRCIVLGGESIKPEHIEQTIQHHSNIQLINHYGPSETTIGSVAQYIDKNKIQDFINIPTIGKPISNTTCYILGKNEELIPIGRVGELCISGAGVGLGYLGDESLTQEKFVPNPYEKGEVLYKTGDLTKWLPDGQIEFLGRVDDQIKVRGFRVEQAEIERKLASHTDIHEAVVLAKDTSEDKFLVGYYTSEADLIPSTIRSYLMERLPDYMVPAYFIQVDSFPLTANGKVDKGSLPEPKLTEESAYIPPSSESEKKLVQIWAEVLNLDKDEVSVESNFFEIGGHSLKAISMLNHIKREFNIKIAMAGFFNSPTIKDLNKKILLSKLMAKKSN